MQVMANLAQPGRVPSCADGGHWFESNSSPNVEVKRGVNTRLPLALAVTHIGSITVMQQSPKLYDRSSNLLLCAKSLYKLSANIMSKRFHAVSVPGFITRPCKHLLDDVLPCKQVKPVRFRSVAQNKDYESQDSKTPKTRFD